MAKTWEVRTDLIDEWLSTLNTVEFERVLAALEYLEDNGPTLGRPFVDRVSGSQHSNMKELRPFGDSADRGAFRLLFAFDLNSSAIVLVAGNKSGQWNTWYAKNISRADKLFADHQANLKRKLRADKESEDRRAKAKKRRKGERRRNT